MKVGNYILNSAKRIEKELNTLSNFSPTELSECSFLEWNNLPSVKKVTQDLKRMYKFEPTSKQPQDDDELKDYIITGIENKLDELYHL